ncbi:MAG TPA: hypothetical protein VK524_25395 [Polyangiaceae bacterium]|nr:hypothetical protein [Polyangiaceae bacterium]
MSDFSLDPLIRAIAAEFQRHGMDSHLKLLRDYYRGYRAHKRWLSGLPRPPWHTELVIEWARIMRLPPFENAYPVLEHGAKCPTCTEKRDPLTDVGIRVAWAGGWVIQCRRCGEAWLELARK